MENNIFWICALLVVGQCGLTLGCGQQYTIRSGDICWNIAQQNGLSVDGLIGLNPGLNCGNLQVGQVICVKPGNSGGGGNGGSQGCTKRVNVNAGDTCWALANNHGTSGGVDGLVALNPGLNCNNLQIGQSVCVSGSSGPTNPDPPPSGGALISKNEFVQAVTQNGYPAPSDEQYNNLIRRAGPAGQIYTKRELAMMLANLLHESDGLRAKEEYSPAPGAYQYPALDVPGKKYHGRGYIQLTWSYNYNAASLALYNDQRLLYNPEQVASNDDIAWSVSFWFWAANVHSRPGVSQGNFGASINAINGGLECNGGWNVAAARKRFQMYSTIYRLWNIPGNPIETGCYN